MSTLLEVKNLKKYFKTPGGMLHAVDDVSFSINRGETLGVVGESGCGKSTLAAPSFIFCPRPPARLSLTARTSPTSTTTSSRSCAATCR